MADGGLFDGASMRASEQAMEEGNIRGREGWRYTMLFDAMPLNSGKDFH